MLYHKANLHTNNSLNLRLMSMPRKETFHISYEMAGGSELSSCVILALNS
jgi:hypothetical protein